MKISHLAMATCALGFAAAIAAAQSDLYIYPQKGQTAEQQSKDEYECHQWAKGQSGYDPMAAQAPAAAPAAPRGGAVRGAAKGAALGAIGGAIGGDAGKGAAVGAGVGAAGGMLGQNAARRQQHQAQQAQAATQQQQYNDFKRAYGACLEGRGYTVK